MTWAKFYLLNSAMGIHQIQKVDQRYTGTDWIWSLLSGIVALCTGSAIVSRTRTRYRSCLTMRSVPVSTGYSTETGCSLTRWTQWQIWNHRFPCPIFRIHHLQHMILVLINQLTWPRPIGDSVLSYDWGPFTKVPNKEKEAPEELRLIISTLLSPPRSFLSTHTWRR